jgi:hypothetical protein
MQNTTQKTNQRMPGRSADVIGNDLGNRPAGATPAAKPAGTPREHVPKPVIKLNLKARTPRH